MKLIETLLSLDQMQEEKSGSDHILRSSTNLLSSTQFGEMDSRIAAERLHIIEPTLTGEAGHCFSFVSSLVHAAGCTPMTIWCGRSGNLAFPGNVQVNQFFLRKARRLQSLWLYRKLLMSKARVFIATADRADLIMLALTARGRIPSDRVYLYIHWFRPSPDKRAQLEKLARRQPEIVILASTASVCEEFRSAGFGDTRFVPYPITPCEGLGCMAENHEFKHLLYAGAARRDKGFPAVVDLVMLLEAKNADIPVTLQTSAGHYVKYDKATKADIRRLEKCSYPHIRRVSDTLPQAGYQRLFAGAICLQLYSQKDFSDRISGVTLDALSNGSPVITLSGTWIARMVEQFDAGLVVDTPEPNEVYGAVQQVLVRYELYRNNALKAGQELQTQNSAKHLLRELIPQ